MTFWIFMLYWLIVTLGLLIGGWLLSEHGDIEIVFIAGIVSGVGWLIAFIVGGLVWLFAWAVSTVCQISFTVAVAVVILVILLFVLWPSGGTEVVIKEVHHYPDGSSYYDVEEWRED